MAGGVRTAAPFDAAGVGSSAASSFAQSRALRCGRTPARIPSNAGRGAVRCMAASTPARSGALADGTIQRIAKATSAGVSEPDDAGFDREDLLFAVALDQRRLVLGLFHVHVLEVVGNEKRELSVQAQRRRGALGADAVFQRAQ